MAGGQARVSAGPGRVEPGGPAGPDRHAPRPQAGRRARTQYVSPAQCRRLVRMPGRAGSGRRHHPQLQAGLRRRRILPGRSRLPRLRPRPALACAPARVLPRLAGRDRSCGPGHGSPPASLEVAGGGVHIHLGLATRAAEWPATARGPGLRPAQPDPPPEHPACRARRHRGLRRSARRGQGAAPADGRLGPVCRRSGRPAAAGHRRSRPAGRRGGGVGLRATGGQRRRAGRSAEVRRADVGRARRPDALGLGGDVRPSGHRGHGPRRPADSDRPRLFPRAHHPRGGRRPVPARRSRRAGVGARGGRGAPRAL